MPVSRSAEAVFGSLESVCAQTLGDFEVLVGDDAGHGRQAVERIGDPRVRYWHNSPQLGFTANHEALLARARGKLVAFLHDDDRWEADYLERAVKTLEANPTTGLVLTAHRELPSGAVPPHPRAGHYRSALPILLNPENRLLPSATVMRRRALADVRSPWPALSCGDMVLYLDAALAGWGVAAVDDPLVSYRRHPEQISADDVHFRRDLAQLLGLYRFDDPAAERMRRRRLATTWLSIARSDLRAERPRSARTSIARARAAEKSPHILIEGLALAALSRCPPLLRLALRGWYAVRGVPPTTRDEAP